MWFPRSERHSHHESGASGVRPLSDRERESVSRVLQAARIPGADQLLAQLPAAQVRGGIMTCLDLEVPHTYPERVVIWVEQGYLSGLELAWFTDDEPPEGPTLQQVRPEET